VCLLTSQPPGCATTHARHACVCARARVYSYLQVPQLRGDQQRGAPLLIHQPTRGPPVQQFPNHQSVTLLCGPFGGSYKCVLMLAARRGRAKELGYARRRPPGAAEPRPRQSLPPRGARRAAPGCRRVPAAGPLRGGLWALAGVRPRALECGCCLPLPDFGARHASGRPAAICMAVRPYFWSTSSRLYCF
jgi:hypothetical protein